MSAPQPSPPPDAIDRTGIDLDAARFDPWRRTLYRGDGTSYVGVEHRERCESNRHQGDSLCTCGFSAELRAAP